MAKSKKNKKSSQPDEPKRKPGNQGHFTPEQTEFLESYFPAYYAIAGNKSKFWNSFYPDFFDSWPCDDEDDANDPNGDKPVDAALTTSNPGASHQEDASHDASHQEDASHDTSHQQAPPDVPGPSDATDTPGPSDATSKEVSAKDPAQAKGKVTLALQKSVCFFFSFNAI